MSHFQFTPTFLLTAMADKFLTVPRYQRSYAWTEDEVRDFWDDMGKSIKEKTEYFMGTIVLSEESETDDQSIIDGQQRLATTTILLSVLRDVFRERGQDAPADAIQQQYLAPYDVTALTRRARLRLNTSDNPFYESEIIDSKGIPPTADSHHLIRAAKQFFRTNIDKIVSENPKSWTTMFAEITSYLQKQARVILVTAPTNADAFTIFETLNDRGADLTIADLLKNYLFSVSGSELDFVQDAWVETISVLNLYQENREFVGFLRHLWSSMYGATRERDLYKNIKAVISDKSSAVQFAKTLRDGAKIYGAILSAESETWKKFTKVTREHVDTLVQLDLEQNRPLLLALLQHFAPAELAKTLKALVAWSVRGLVAGSIGGGKAEKYFCDAAVDIRAGKIKKATQLFAKMEPIVPNDTAFREDFTKFRTTKGPLARYMLFAIEQQMRNEKEPELILNTNVEEMNLEHLLPRNPKQSDWPSFTEEEAKFYCYRIGNMTVMKKSENNSIGNKAFTIKKAALGKSTLHLNKEIAAEKDWTKVQIAERQDRLAGRALTVWPLK